MSRRTRRKQGEETKKHSNATTIRKKDLRHKIISLMSKSPAKTCNYKEIAAKLGINGIGNRKLIEQILREYTVSEKLIEVQRGKYKLKDRGAYIIGTVDLTTKGHAYIVSDKLEDDVLVTQRNLHRAFDGDLVSVYLYAKRDGMQLEGEVIEIIKRNTKKIVGKIEISRNFAFLRPLDRKIPYDIFIPENETKGAKNGDIVSVEITEWAPRAKSPTGKVFEVFGEPGENETEMHAILAQYELPYSYPEKLIEEAEQIPAEILKEEIKKRVDFRNITTFTIDPDDAKDFDDALSLVTLENGNYQIGVHIADVTHYVQPKTNIDKEAIERATSVYLVDRVVPMLPERLSNFICSLRPNEDKLTYSAIFEIRKDAKIVDFKLAKTIINSDKRFTYNNAQEVLDKGAGEFYDELNTLNTLAKKIREKRFTKGAVNFERTEIKFNLDDAGKPLGVFFKDSKDTNRLIEEFMLLANKYVAELIGKTKNGKKPKTFVYRVHDRPDSDKIAVFKKFIKRCGYNLATANRKETSQSLNNILSEVKGKAEQNLVETIAIRTMAKAEYSIDNIGHYGLSFEYYSHFTSPIRRYPDMMVHRLLFDYLNGGKSRSENKYIDLCKQSSKMEERASRAERDSIKYKQVEFMQDKIGEVFAGVISGVAEWGIYVEITETKTEGLVPIRDMNDDYYVFDEKNYRIIGKRRKKIYQLGDRVEIEIIKANLVKKQLDFALVE